MAQLHSNDMQRRGFFSHKNPEGEMPSDRARRLGLSERVAENLAKTSSLIQAHVGLANSPGHFKNSVNKEYERVGFGIAIDRRGLILTVILGPRDLNKNPLTSNEKSSFNTGLVNTILSKNPNLTRKGENTKLSRDVSNWMKTDRR